MPSPTLSSISGRDFSGARMVLPSIAGTFEAPSRHIKGPFEAPYEAPSSHLYIHTYIHTYILVYDAGLERLREAGRG